MRLEIWQNYGISHNKFTALEVLPGEGFVPRIGFFLFVGDATQVAPLLNTSIEKPRETCFEASNGVSSGLSMLVLSYGVTCVGSRKIKMKPILGTSHTWKHSSAFFLVFTTSRNFARTPASTSIPVHLPASWCSHYQ